MPSIAPTEKQVRLPIAAWRLADRAAKALDKQQPHKVYINTIVAQAISEFVVNHPELNINISTK